MSSEISLFLFDNLFHISVVSVASLRMTKGTCVSKVASFYFVMLTSLSYGFCLYADSGTNQSGKRVVSRKGFVSQSYAIR